MVSSSVFFLLLKIQLYYAIDFCQSLGPAMEMELTVVNIILLLGLLPSENVSLMTLFGVMSCVFDSGGFVMFPLMT